MAGFLDKRQLAASIDPFVVAGLKLLFVKCGDNVLVEGRLRKISWCSKSFYYSG